MIGATLPSTKRTRLNTMRHFLSAVDPFWLSVVVSAVLLFAYLIFVQPYTWHSDLAARSVYVAEMIRTGSPFPADWAHANGEVWLIGHQLFILPLTLLLNSNGPVAYALATIVFATLFGTAWNWFLRECEISARSRAVMLVIALTAGGGVRVVLDHMFVQGGYGWIFLPLMVQLGLHARLYRGANCERRVLLGLALVVAFQTAYSARAVATAVLPYLGMLLLSVLHDAASGLGSRNRRVALRAAASTGAGAVGGLVLNAALQAAVMMANPLQGAAIVSPYDIAGKLSAALSAALILLGYDTHLAGARLFSFGGIEAGYRFLMLLAVLGAIVLCLRQWNRLSRIARDVTVFSLISLILCVFTLFFTTAAGALPRYFLIPFFLFLAVFGHMLDKAQNIVGMRSWNATVMAGLVLPLLVFAAAGSVRVAQAGRGSEVNEEGAGLRRWVARNPYDKIATFLVDEGLGHGYATYWNAHITTLLTGQRTRVAPVSLGDAVLPYYWVSSKAHYRPSFHQGRTFLLLQKHEAEKTNAMRLSQHLGPPTAVHAIDDVEVRVYDYNIAERLPGWPVEAEDVPTRDWTCFLQGGSMIEQKPGVKCHIKLSNGEVAYGPYVGYPSGHYTVTYEVEADPACSGSEIGVDVAVTPHSGGVRVLTNKSALLPQSGVTRIVLGFENPFDSDVSTLEFRSHQRSGCAILKGVWVSPEIHETETPKPRDWTCFLRGGTKVEDEPGAKCSISLSEGEVAYGPYVGYPSGTYTATYEIEADPVCPDTEVGMDVAFTTEAGDVELLASKSVPLRQAGVTRVSLDFENPDGVGGNTLEFRAHQTSGCSVLKRVQVERHLQENL